MSDAADNVDATLPQLREPPPLWRNVSFHLLWISTFASGLADRLITNASWGMLGIGVNGADESSIQAAADFFFFLPYVIWSPIAGWLVDRLPRKWVMFAADETRGLLVLLAFTMIPAGLAVSETGIPPEHHWKVYLVMLGVGIMAATFVAAKLSIVPNVVGFKNLQRANSMVVSMGIIGNLLGFLVSAQMDDNVRLMVIVSALAYMISGAFWAFIATPFKPRGVSEHGDLEAGGHNPLEILRQIGDGVRYAWQHRPMRVLIVAAAIVWGGTSIYMPALGAINGEYFGGVTANLHYLLFTVGLGMLIGSVLMAVVTPRRGGELLMTFGLFGTALFIGLQMIVVWSYALAIVVALFTGICSTVLLIPLYSTLQRISADHIRGRVFAAKEILTEAPKVALSLLVWQLPHSDSYMRIAGGGLALLLLYSAVYGLVRYVLRGPIESKYLNFMWRLSRLLADAIHRVKIVGKHNFPSKGGFLLVSNHTGGVDPLLIQCHFSRVVRWMMAKEYMIGLLSRFWKRFQPIPVARSGRDTGAVRDAVRTLREGEPVGIFPEGRLNRESDEMGKFQPGIGLIAGKADVPILPVYLSGTPRGGTPFASYIKPSRSVVTIGKPFRLDPNLDRHERTAEIRRRIEALRPDRQPTPSQPLNRPDPDATA